MEQPHKHDWQEISITVGNALSSTTLKSQICACGMYMGYRLSKGSAAPEIANVKKES